jgi:hypothetical protein
LQGVCFIDADIGVAVGDSGTIVRTTNGGANWISQISGTDLQLTSVCLTDENNGWIVGGGATGFYGLILNTTNSGTTWSIQISDLPNRLHDVCFVDSVIGTVVGGGGTILRTTDGGFNWFSQTSGTSNTLYGVSFTDANLGSAVGSYGTILRTMNGGIPVELISFTSSVNQNNVTLDWATATELNNQGFEIERASSSTTPVQVWEKVGFVPGAGTTTEPRSYSFIDSDLEPGNYSYRLKQIDYDGTFEYSEEVEAEIHSLEPVEFSLEQNYPNPFNPVTIIRYSLLSKSLVRLKVYNLLGEEVTTLINELKEAGSYEVEFNSHSGSVRNLPSGVYLYRINAGEYTATKKMILLK